MITLETRREAFEASLDIKKPMHDKILEAFGDGAYTAREIARKMGYGNDLNKVRPRINELCNINKLQAIGKRKDYSTGKSVAVFKAVKE